MSGCVGRILIAAMLADALPRLLLKSNASFSRLFHPRCGEAAWLHGGRDFYSKRSGKAFILLKCLQNPRVCHVLM
jgi:hypothetical protein